MGFDDARPNARGDALTLLERAGELVGTPYAELHGCWGLVQRLLADDGIELPDLDAPYRAAVGNGKGDEVVETERRERGWIFVQQIAARDVLLFRIAKGWALHVGLALGDGRMVHARMRQGVVIESIEPMWSRFLVGAYRHPCTHVPTNHLPEPV